MTPEKPDSYDRYGIRYRVAPDGIFDGRMVVDVTDLDHPQRVKLVKEYRNRHPDAELVKERMEKIGGYWGTWGTETIPA